jgi:hypothetical protein
MTDGASWIAIGATLTSACVGLYAAAGSNLRDKVEQFIPQLRGQAPLGGDRGCRVGCRAGNGKAAGFAQRSG